MKKNKRKRESPNLLKGVEDKKIDHKVVSCCSLMEHSFIYLGFSLLFFPKKLFFSHKYLKKKIENGELHAFGQNKRGQFGNGVFFSETSPFPKLVTSEIRVKLVSGGHFHSLIYTEDSRLLACGNNGYNQLGVKREEGDQNTFVEVMKDQKISQICCQSFGSVILRMNGDVLVFGRNDNRELGMDTKGKNISQPTLLTNDKEIQRIHCGAYFTVIEKRNAVFLVVGKLIEETYLIEKAKQIEIREEIKQIACGTNFILFLKQNGDLWFHFLIFHFSTQNFFFSMFFKRSYGYNQCG